MKRKPLMAGNWKMNTDNSEGVALAQQIVYQYDKGLAEQVEALICPPFIGLKSISTVIAFEKSHLALGAQNVYWEDAGAYTGEISPVMLKATDCSYCIVGHSERREFFHETDSDVNKKAKALFAHGITPIVCCGETLDVRDAGKTNEFVTSQVRGGLEGISDSEAAKIVVAYEPIWAIGTGHIPTPEAANAVCGAIRETVREMFGSSAADSMRVLYGGSVKAENIHHFMPESDIDGALVGGAALDAKSFIALIKGACSE